MNHNPQQPDSTAGPLHIDLRKTLREKLGKKSLLIPPFAVNWLSKTICADRLNRLLTDNYPATGAQFCQGVFRDLDITVNTEGTQNLPPATQRRVLIISNHPLGGLDGMALIDFFSRHFGTPVHFVVNDILMAIKPLNDVFVPVNKHGKQSRQTLATLDRIFNGPDPVIIFPAGLVSRKDKNGDIHDLEWQKMFVNRAITSQRDIIPVYFSGKNSDFFYNFAQRRKKLGLKFNIEMIYLPREVFRAAGTTFTLVCGKTVPWQQLRGGKQAAQTAQQLKDLVYSLKTNNGRTYHRPGPA